MEVLCINDSYSQDILNFWSEHGVSYPKKDGYYTVRESITHTNGKTGYRLNEILNPEIPIKHPILGVIMFEPTFNKDRFRIAEDNLESVNIEELFLELVN